MELILKSEEPIFLLVCMWPLMVVTLLSSALENFLLLWTLAVAHNFGSVNTRTDEMWGTQIVKIHCWRKC